MDATAAAFDGYRCLDCGTHIDARLSHTCEECGGRVTVVYDDGELADIHGRLFANGRSEAGGRTLPLPFEDVVSLGEGQTRLTDCPTLSEELGATVHVKNEGANPTGSLSDREMSLAVTAVREGPSAGVGLPTTGNGGQSAAAYAARCGLDAECFVPSRAPFENKAMINVHGGAMNVVGGRYPDALEIFENARVGAEWQPISVTDTPFRREGAKGVAYELVAALDGGPDAIVHPTGHGTQLRGIYDGFAELAATDTIETPPRLYAAQPSGCSPIVSAWEAGESSPAAVEHPDTICGAIEIPDPGDGDLALEALEATAGGAVAVEDEVLLEAALNVAQAGVPVSAIAGIAIAGLRRMADDGEIDRGESVVVIDPVSANREPDLLRSRLMSKGV